MDPMARFSGDWEKKFISPASSITQWKTEKSAAAAGEVSTRRQNVEKARELEQLSEIEIMTPKQRSVTGITSAPRSVPLSIGMWDDAMYLDVQEQANKNGNEKFGGPKKVRVPVFYISHCAYLLCMIIFLSFVRRHVSNAKVLEGLLATTVTAPA